MKKLNTIFYLCAIFVALFSYQIISAQCATNYVEVCDGTVTGQSFGTFDIDGSNCLVNNGNAGYVVININTTGTLNLLVNGSATTGFIDVAIFNVPPGVDPCTAAGNGANQLACNFAPASGGCAGFGNVSSSGCTSVIAGPTANAGDRIIIIAENYSSASTTFDVQLYDNTGNPTTGNKWGRWC